MVRNILFRLLIVLLVLPAGCKVQRDTAELPLEVPGSFSSGGDAPVPNKWWMVFGDTTLNALIDTALNSNFSLMTAWHRLQESRAVVDRESSYLFPDLEAFCDAEANRPESENLDSERFSAGLGAFYEVDLWGRIRSQIDARRYIADASRADYQAAALSLAAEITITWYRLLEAANQVELIRSQIETNERVLAIIRNRFGSGMVRSVDILRQKQLLEATREQKYYAEGRFEVLKHQLNVLTGRPPQDEILFAAHALPELPPLPVTGIPIELVERRPDVRSAWLLLQAADSEMAAAISNKYPRLTISASLYSTSGNIGNLFENWAFSVAGNLLAPVFYGGRLSAEADRTEAAKYQRLYEYGQRVLTAFHEVEDALARETAQEKSLSSLQRQLELSVQTTGQLRNEYLNGMSNYLDVLVAMDQEQRLRRNLLDARLMLVENRISLYRALAGGFQTEREQGQALK
ncbi:MAG: TolC family protein [Bacteroidota bacterium]